jgi:dynein heavy chain
MPGVEEKRERVKIETEIAMKDAEAVAAVKQECEDGLAKAIPILNQALAALGTLTVADVSMVKAMASPPAGVRLVMEAVCVMLDVEPDRIPDPNG